MNQLLSVHDWCLFSNACCIRGRSGCSRRWLDAVLALAVEATVTLAAAWTLGALAARGLVAKTKFVDAVFTAAHLQKLLAAANCLHGFGLLAHGIGHA